MFLTLCAGWVCSIVISYSILAPNVDDGLYLIPSLGMIHYGYPAFQLGNTVKPLFYMMPAFPFLNGIFLGIQHYLGIGIGPYSYRNFNFLCLMVLLFLSCRLIKKIKGELHKNNYALENSFLLLLAITPFMMQCWTTRPELCGLVFFVSALLYLLPVPHKKLSSYGIGGILLGISSVMHPVLFLGNVLSGAVLCIKLLKEKNVIPVVVFTLSCAVAPLLYMVWFFLHFEEAHAQLLQRTGEVVATDMASYLRGITYITDIIFFRHSTKGPFIKIYESIFFLPFSILFVVVMVSLLWRNYWLVLFKNDVVWIAIALVGASFFVIFYIQPFLPYFLIISYYLTLSTLCILSQKCLRKVPADI